MAHHVTVHPDLEKIAYKCLIDAQKEKAITDFYVKRCDDDLELIMTHTKCVDNKDVHILA